MTYKFTASHVFNQDDGYMIMLGFANDEFEPSRFVLIQKAHEFDAQDIKLGMNKLHIQVEDQSRAQYGGITSFNIRGDSIVIELDDLAKSSLKIDGDIEIMLDLKHPDLENVISVLKDIAEKENILFKVSRPPVR